VALTDVHDVTVDVTDTGPLVGRVVVRRTFGPSSSTITYELAAGSGALVVHVELDWQHDEHLLSMAFPLDVRADVARCDVQFGTVARPTHPSNPWDAAKFEVCAHRFVDVAEPASGSPSSTTAATGTACSTAPSASAWRGPRSIPIRARIDRTVARGVGRALRRRAELRERRIGRRLEQQRQVAGRPVERVVRPSRVDALEGAPRAVVVALDDEPFALEPGGVRVEPEVDHGLDAADRPNCRGACRRIGTTWSPTVHPTNSPR
jgi:hypothetical protein